MKNPTLVFLLLFAGLLAHAQGDTKQPIVPNMYELSGGRLNIEYSTSSFNGQPLFIYKDGTQTLKFRGSQIRTAQTEIGTLVSVTILMPTDAGPTTFTLLLPAVSMTEPSGPVQVHTYGITTVHRFFFGKATNDAATQAYTATELSGTASLVMF
jgi:hypothetical protein